MSCHRVGVPLPSRFLYRAMLLGSVALCTIGGLTSAYAQDAAAPPLADAKELERADALFKEGNNAFNAKDFKRARGLYLEALSIKETYDIAGHLGKAELELGLHRDAAEHLALCLRLAPPHISKSQFEPVVQDLELAKKEVATVTVTAPAGAALFVDGKEIGKAPLKHEVYVETGRRRFEAKLGAASKVEERDLAKGEAATIPLVVAGTKPPVEGRPSWPGWLMGASGLVVAGVGGALIGVGQSNTGEASDIGAEIEEQGGTCEPPVGPGSERCSEGQDALDSAGSLTSAGIALTAVGGAVLIAGIVYLVFPEESASSTAITAYPWVGESTAGFIVSGAF